MLKLYDRILEQTTRLGLTGKELGSLLGLKKKSINRLEKSQIDSNTRATCKNVRNFRNII